jgi:hypothetical protein
MVITEDPAPFPLPEPVLPAEGAFTHPEIHTTRGGGGSLLVAVNPKILSETDLGNGAPRSSGWQPRSRTSATLPGSDVEAALAPVVSGQPDLEILTMLPPLSMWACSLPLPRRRGARRWCVPRRPTLPQYARAFWTARVFVSAAKSSSSSATRCARLWRMTLKASRPRHPTARPAPAPSSTKRRYLAPARSSSSGSSSSACRWSPSSFPGRWRKTSSPGHRFTTGCSPCS